jgi:hypothetical protein
VPCRKANFVEILSDGKERLGCLFDKAEAYAEILTPETYASYYQFTRMGHPQDVSAEVVPATNIIQSSEELKEKPHKWYYYLWDTLDKPKEERWFMFKLDAALLTFASLGYFIKYLDQTNINSAFVSGMYV